MPTPNPLADAPIQAAAPKSPAPAGEVHTLKSLLPDLPDEVSKIPVVGWVATGKPPAVRFPPGHYFPELKPLQIHLPALLKEGFNIYKANSGDIVFFNPIFMPVQELQAIDKSGKLEATVPDYGTMTGKGPQEMSEDDANEQVKINDELQRNLTQAGFQPQQPTPGAQPSPQTPVPPAPPRVQQMISRARQPMQNPSPTSGPVPGAGRILNGLLQK